MKTATLTSTLLHAGAAAGLYYGGVIGSAPSPSPCCLDNAMPVVWEAPSHPILPQPLDTDTLDRHATLAMTGTEASLRGPEGTAAIQKPTVIPAKAGIQERTGTDHEFSLDPCLRRDDNKVTIGDKECEPFTSHPNNKPPTYPEEARERELEGHGMIRLYLTKDGNVERTEILTPMDSLFIKEAETVLRTWQFQGTLPAYVDVPLDFSLRMA